MSQWQHQQFQKVKDDLEEGQVLCREYDIEASRGDPKCTLVYSTSYYPSCCALLLILANNGNPQLTTHEFVFISDDLTHDAHMVKHCVTETLKQLEDIVPVKHMVQFTDGRSAQYKSKTPFADVSLCETDHDIKIDISMT